MAQPPQKVTAKKAPPKKTAAKKPAAKESAPSASTSTAKPPAAKPSAASNSAPKSAAPKAPAKAAAQTSDAKRPSAPTAKRKAEPRAKTPEKKTGPKKVNLALQGGGAHGAFTWGVLDRLLERDDLIIEGISGTSAGAMNGAVMVCGLFNGGNDYARERLERFWTKVSKAGSFSPLKPSPIDRLQGNWNLDHSPAYLMMDMMTRMMSPYEINPANYHPLRDILEEEINLTCISACEAVKLYVCATNVLTGRIKIFDHSTLSIDAVLASACLPTLFQAIEIDGEYFWDGGFMGNPAIYPLAYNCTSADVILVQINPINRKSVPTTAREILDRVNEISFNSSLVREMRAINFVGRLLDDGHLDPKDYKRLLIHCIEAEDDMMELGFSSKLMADWGFLCHLKELGRATADQWLEDNWDKVGVEGTVNMREKFL